MTRPFRPKLVIFDMDGLLFDTEALLFTFCQPVYARYGYTLTREMHARTTGAAGEAYAAIVRGYFGDGVPVREILDESFARMYADIDANGPRVKEGVVPLLDYLREKDIPRCIVTSSPLKDAEHFTKLSGLRDAFSFIVAKERPEESKPAPALYLRCLEQAGLSPSEALVLEDSGNGILAAAAAGIPVICVVDMLAPEEEILRKTAAVLSRADELIPLLAQEAS